MKIVKISDVAYFVPSYSEQTIVRAYSTAMSVQSLSFSDSQEDRKDLAVKKEKRGQEQLSG